MLSNEVPPVDSTGPFTIAIGVEQLDDRTFDRQLLNQLAPLYRRLREEPIPLAASEVALDLRPIRSLYPYAALGVLILLEILADVFGRPVQLLLPASVDAPECVKWMAE